MDWKEFRVEPEVGMFEKIQHRVRVRRAWRVAGVSTVVIAAFGVAAALFMPKNDTETVAIQQQPAVEHVNQTVADQPVNINDLQKDNATSAVVDINTPVVKEGARSADNIADLILSPSNHTAEPIVASEMPHMPMDEQLYVAVQEMPQVGPKQHPHTSANTSNDAANEPEQQSIAQSQSKSGEPQPEPYHEDNVLWVPNVIIPNGENVENRTFSIIATSPVTDFNIHIYNRGGRLLYSSNDPNFKWDAVYNGTPVPQGAYVYVATFRDTDGNPRRQAGTVTVIR